MAVEKSFFGKIDETEVYQYTMSNGSGMTIKVIDRGATIRCIVVPDKAGNMVDVALAYGKAECYKTNAEYFGNAVGRYANRIGGASMEIGGKEYNLGANSGKDCLHGGFLGFDKKQWDVKIVNDGDEPELKFGLFSLMAKKVSPEI